MKYLILLSIFLLSTLGYSQIPSIAVSDPQNKKINYDSLSNFLGENFHNYLNQELIVKPKSENLRKFGFDGFILDYRKPTTGFERRTNIYECCDGSNSKYLSLVNKSFIVVDVIEQDRLMKHQNLAYLKLREQETEDTLYFAYNTKYSSAFPFVVKGYYDKYKSFFEGHEVLIRPFPKLERGNQKKTLDIETGEEIEIPRNEYFQFIDIIIEEKYFDLSILVKDSKGRKFTFPLETRHFEIQRILRKDEVESYKSKFGLKNWEIIIQDKVQIGFTEEMVVFVFGKPKKINRSSSGDQWVYDDQYLYFSNNKLTAFN
jgi:hypothetical protein